MLKIGEIIRKERVKCKISAKILAEMSGCTERAIHYYERQERVPNVYATDQILKALGVELVIGKKKE